MRLVPVNECHLKATHDLSISRLIAQGNDLWPLQDSKTPVSRGEDAVEKPSYVITRDVGALDLLGCFDESRFH